MGKSRKNQNRKFASEAAQKAGQTMAAPVVGAGAKKSGKPPTPSQSAASGVTDRRVTAPAHAGEPSTVSKPESTVVTVETTRTPRMAKKVAAPVRGPKLSADRKSRSGSETRQFSKVIASRYNEEEHEKLLAAAQAAGLKPAGYQRVQSLKETKSRVVRSPSVDSQKVARLLGLVGNIASNINQVAVVANTKDKILVGNLQEAVRELSELRPLFFEALGRKR